MKLKRLILILTILLFLQNNYVQAQRVWGYGFGNGSLGNVVLDNSEPIVYMDDDRYTLVDDLKYIQVNLSKYTDEYDFEVLPVVGATALDVGDLILVIKMENDGTVNDYTNMTTTNGQFNIGRIINNWGNNKYRVEIPLCISHEKFLPGKVQVIKIKEYENLEIKDGVMVTCHPYDHATGTGGVVVFVVNNTLTITDGTIDASGKGYAPGIYGSTSFGTGGDGGNFVTNPNNILFYTKGGFDYGSNDDGNGMDGGDEAFQGTLGLGDIVLDGTCGYTIGSAYFCGAGGHYIYGEEGMSAPFGTAFPITNYNDTDVNKNGPIYMGNSGQGGNGGQGGGSSGYGGGGAGSGQDGSAYKVAGDQGGYSAANQNGHIGATGGIGGIGGGIVLIRAADIEIPYYNSSTIYIRTDGTLGLNGDDAYDYTNPGTYGLPNYGGNGANGGIDGSTVYLPGVGGRAGQPGKASGGGDGGNGGSVLIVHSSSNTVDLEESNISAQGGDKGSGGNGGYPAMGSYNGSTGSYYDLAGSGCTYEMTETNTNPCECFHIFSEIMPNTVGNWSGSGLNYSFTDGTWNCTFSQEPNSCGGYRFECVKTVFTPGGNGGETSPNISETKIWRCDFEKGTPQPLVDVEELMAHFYIEMQAGATFTINGEEVSIGGQTYDFVFDGLNFYQFAPQSNNKLVKCCEEEPLDEDLRGKDGNDGEVGAKGPGGTLSQQRIFTEEDYAFKKAINDSMIVWDESIDIFPNPASNHIVVTGHYENPKILIQIIDMDGKIVAHQELELMDKKIDYKMDVTNLISGAYVVQVINISDNSIIKQLKVTKI